MTEIENRRDQRDSPRPLLLTGAVGGGDLFRLWGPGFKGDFLNNGEDIYLCSGTCMVRGPLWVHLKGVEWEDINCPECLVMIDMVERIKDLYETPQEEEKEA